MAATTMLNAVSAALSVVSARTADLLQSLPHTAVAIPGSSWTVREAAVHLAMVGFRYAGMVYGEPTQYPSLAPEICARLNDQLNADIPESNPHKLAASYAREPSASCRQPSPATTPRMFSSTAEW
jgi:hypothetical protein